MKKLILLTIFAIAHTSCKEKVNQSTEIDVEGKVIVATELEWIALFDGASLDKWRGYLTDEVYPEWTIEDGEMLFTPSEDGGRNIITKEKYTNFELSLEWKISEGGNSGVFWGVFENEKYSEAYQTGPEIQVLDNDRHPDAKSNPKFHQAGALYDMVQPKYDVCNPAGEWNTCVLIINHIENKGSVTLNGTVIVKFPVHGEQWEVMVNNSKFKNWEGFGKHPTGHIGLQDHGDKVWYRNIKIKKLNN